MNSAQKLGISRWALCGLAWCQRRFSCCPHRRGRTWVQSQSQETVPRQLAQPASLQQACTSSLALFPHKFSSWLGSDAVCISAALSWEVARFASGKGLVHAQFSTSGLVPDKQKISEKPHPFQMCRSPAGAFASPAQFCGVACSRAIEIAFTGPTFKAFAPGQSQ